MDFSKYPLSGRTYSGSEKKIGLLIDGEKYFVKFRKVSLKGLLYNHVSEYLGSHIFNLLGLKAQKTLLGTYQGKEVVLIQDFLPDGMTFVPFQEVVERMLDTDETQAPYSFTDIMKRLRANKKLTKLREMIHVFWDMYIIDALIGNFDRHGSNWGFLKRDNIYSLAPIFDNGSSLYPQMNDEEEMHRVLNSEEEIDKRIFDFPTSQIKLRGKKSSYFQVINSLKFTECNEALVRIHKRIRLSEIDNLVDSVDFISTIHKEFYKTMIQKRYEKIIHASYLKMEEHGIEEDH